LDINFIIGWSIGICNFILTVFLYFKSKDNKYRNAICEYVKAIDSYENAIAHGQFESIENVSKELDTAINKIRSMNE